MPTTICSPNHATSACEARRLGRRWRHSAVRCLSWAHEACLAKSVFETGGCPTCRKSISLIDNEIILGQAAADGDAEKLRRLLENGIQHSPRGLFDSTPLLQAAQNGQRGTIRLLLEHGVSVSERHCILHRQAGTQRQQTSFSYTGQIYLLSTSRDEHSYT
jgi:hypothetical protein